MTKPLDSKNLWFHCHSRIEDEKVKGEGNMIKGKGKKDAGNI